VTARSWRARISTLPQVSPKSGRDRHNAVVVGGSDVQHGSDPYSLTRPPSNSNAQWPADSNSHHCLMLSPICMRLFRSKPPWAPNDHRRAAIDIFTETDVPGVHRHVAISLPSSQGQVTDTNACR